jgi:hypothetical protein
MLPERLRGRDAYPYTRFSSRIQEKGASLKRQRRLAAEVSAWLGTNLMDEHSDSGVSAWRGANGKEGALSLIIKLGEEGRVARGSVLLVEAIDRVSRETILDAMLTLTRILRGGWVIVTCEDRTIYDEEALVNGAIYNLINRLQQAHSTANRISSTVSDVWAEKRRAATERMVPLSHHCAAWLRVVPKDGFPANTELSNCRYEVQEAQAASIRRVFELAESGLGRDRITQKMNENDDAPLGRAVDDRRGADGRWSSLKVSKILRDERVIGYAKLADGTKALLFPPVVEADLWQRVREVCGKRQRQTGIKSSGAKNLFPRLIYCMCGGSMVRRAGGRSRISGADRWDALRCSNSLDNRGCPHKGRYPLRLWERPLIKTICISPPPIRDEVASEIQEMKARAVHLDSQIEARQRSLARLAGEADSDSAVAAFREAKNATDQLRSARERLRADIAAREVGGGKEARKQLAQLIDAAVEARDVEAREKIRTLLPLVVERITITEGGGMVALLLDGQSWTFGPDATPLTIDELEVYIHDEAMAETVAQYREIIRPIKPIERKRRAA